MYKSKEVDSIPEDVKIIDWESKGNVVRFYFGEKTCKDYYGDDWNDYPWEHNAGSVYFKFVKFIVDIAFDFNISICEPRNADARNLEYCKDDFKDEHAPFMLVIPAAVIESYGCILDDYYSWLGAKDIIKLYFNMSYEELNRILPEGEYFILKRYEVECDKDE